MKVHSCLCRQACLIQVLKKTSNILRHSINVLSAIPEVEVAVGKWGRVNSALDPAPIQMFENTINYRPEYILDENGHRMQFKVDKKGNYILKDSSTYNPADEASE